MSMPHAVIQATRKTKEWYFRCDGKSIGYYDDAVLAFFQTTREAYIERKQLRQAGYRVRVKKVKS